MTDIVELVQDSVSKIATSGTLDKIIEDALTETVKSIVSNQLRSYSEFGKALQAKIEADLTVDLSRVSFVEYNKVVLNLIEGAVNNAITSDAAAKLKSDVEALFGAPPKSIKLSELIAKYIEESRDESDGAEYIGLIIERKDGVLRDSVGLGLHPTNKKNKYRHMDGDVDSWHDCDIYFSIRLDKDTDQANTGTLSYTWDKSGVQPHAFMPTCLHGTSRLLYQMYCAGSKIEFDQGFNADDYDTERGYND